MVACSNNGTCMEICASVQGLHMGLGDIVGSGAGVGSFHCFVEPGNSSSVCSS